MTPTDDESQAAEPATLWRSFKDDSRHITSLIPAPRYTFLKHVCLNPARRGAITSEYSCMIGAANVGYIDADCHASKIHNTLW